jgi:hypothetical protein
MSFGSSYLICYNRLDKLLNGAKAKRDLAFGCEITLGKRGFLGKNLLDKLAVPKSNTNFA